MNLKSCVFRVLGYDLNNAEIQELISWYERIGQYRNKSELYPVILAFLVETFPNKTVYLKEEDTSDISVLLSALDNAIKG